MSAKQKHYDALVALFTAGDEAGATRYYVEHRVSYQTFKEARGRAITWIRWHRLSKSK